MTTLTDAYVAETLQCLPKQQRDEIGRELRASISDAIDSRVADGEKPEVAEYAALLDLGDPAALAASYAREPQTLISSRMYSVWSRVTRLACMTTLPIVFVVLVVVNATHHHNIWVTIFNPVGITLTVAMYMLTIITAIFALADRGRMRAEAEGRRWTPDRLTRTDIG